MVCFWMFLFHIFHKIPPNKIVSVFDIFSILYFNIFRAILSTRKDCKCGRTGDHYESIRKISEKYSGIIAAFGIAVPAASIL